MSKVKVLMIWALLFSSILMPIAVYKIADAQVAGIGISNTQPTPLDINVTSLQGPSVSQRLATRTQQAWPWYITRAAGIIAIILLVLLILSGIGLITGFTFKVLEPLNAWATHKALGLAFGAAVLVHVIALLFDSYVKFNIVQILVPFASSYKPTTLLGHSAGSLYVALGVIALYIIAIIIGTSLLIIDKKSWLWKLIHLFSYLAAVLVYFHVLYLGTDFTHGFFRVMWIIIGYIVAIGMLYRLKRARSI